LWGVTYKKDIDDLRESPALDVIEELIRREAKVDYHDPYISKLDYDGISLKSKPLTDSALSSADIVAIVTNHSRLDYAKIARKAKFIFDARNALKGYSVDAAKIVKL